VVKASTVTPQGPGAGRPRTKAGSRMKKIILEISVPPCEPRHICSLSMKTTGGWRGGAFPPRYFGMWADGEQNEHDLV